MLHIHTAKVPEAARGDMPHSFLCMLLDISAGTDEHNTELALGYGSEKAERLSMRVQGVLRKKERDERSESVSGKRFS